jgi:hypothetical protein
MITASCIVPQHSISPLWDSYPQFCSINRFDSTHNRTNRPISYICPSRNTWFHSPRSLLCSYISKFYIELSEHHSPYFTTMTLPFGLLLKAVQTTTQIGKWPILIYFVTQLGVISGRLAHNRIHYDLIEVIGQLAHPKRSLPFGNEFLLSHTRLQFNEHQNFWFLSKRKVK